MALSKFADTWKLMNDFKFVLNPDSIHDDISCSICKNLMTDSCIGACGCQYCYKCITEYIGDNDKYCPGDNMKCKEFYLNIDKDVFRDIRMNIKILKSSVLCPNEFCNSPIELSLMREHLRVCTKRSEGCPFMTIECDKGEYIKEETLIHLHNDNLPHMELLLECIHNLRNEVNGMKSSFEMSNLTIDSLKEELRNKDIIIREMNEENVDLKKEIKKELEEQKKELKIQKKFAIVEMERIKTDSMKEIEREKKKTNEEIVKIKKEIMEEIAANKNETESVKKELRMKEIQIKEIKEENERQIENLKKEMMEERRENEIQKRIMEEGMIEVKREMVERNRETIDQMRKTQFCNIDGAMRAKYERMKNERRRMNDLGAMNELCPIINEDIVWKIDEISKKKKGKRIFSESFYSNHYKFCLSIYVGTDDNLYISCRIMRGDSDDKVQWPMKLPFTISVIDQETMERHKSETIEYDTYVFDKRAFNRPLSNMKNFYIGTNDLIQYSSIKDNRSIIFNDSIIVSCVIGDE